jgi:hypothetical protein
MVVTPGGFEERAMSKTVHQKMHQQHVEWDKAAETWQGDISHWKKGLEAALLDLDAIREAMQDSLIALGHHADSVWEHQQRLKAHEAVVCEEAKAASNQTDKAWAETHDAESSRHQRLGDAHERIKRHQHGVVAEVKRLLGKMMEAI